MSLNLSTKQRVINSLWSSRYKNIFPELDLLNSIITISIISLKDNAFEGSNLLEVTLPPFSA